MTINQKIEQWLLSHQVKSNQINRPFVTLSYAQSWDGSITTRTGDSLALSGPEATRLTHQIRSLHDGILVGIGTVLTDNPQLTAREWLGPNPQPIVLDSQLRMPVNARLCQHTDKNCWVLTCLPDTQQYNQQVEIITVRCDSDGRVDLIHAMHLLWDKGIKMLMVEGGSDVITAFLKAQLADAIVLTIAPTLVGGYKAVGHLGINQKHLLPQIRELSVEMLEDDLIMWGNVNYQTSNSQQDYS